MDWLTIAFVAVVLLTIVFAWPVKPPPPSKQGINDLSGWEGFGGNMQRPEEPMSKPPLRYRRLTCSPSANEHLAGIPASLYGYPKGEGTEGLVMLLFDNGIILMIHEDQIKVIETSV